MERLVYMNGAMVAESAAAISIFDVGRMYGATFYESVRTFRHKPFHLDRHLERLRRSLTYAGFLSSLDFKRVEEAVQKAVEVNEHLTHKDDDFWVCVEVTPGTAFPMPLVSQKDSTPTVFAYSSPLPHDEYARCYTEGKSVVTSLYRNIPPQSFEQRCKNRSRLSHFLSKRDAYRIDPRSFALMLDQEGFLTEGTGANIFLVRDGVLSTPTTRNILNGISRCYVIELAGRLSIEVREEDLNLYDAYTADEAFWTTSSYCILPICSFDGRRIGQSYPGPIAQKLLAEWSRDAGVDIVAQSRRFARKGA
jgi:branched-chain amino acid aminotransferase